MQIVFRFYAVLCRFHAFIPTFMLIYSLSSQIQSRFYADSTQSPCRVYAESMQFYTDCTHYCSESLQIIFRFYAESMYCYVDFMQGFSHFMHFMLIYALQILFKIYADYMRILCRFCVQVLVAKRSFRPDLPKEGAAQAESGSRNTYKLLQLGQRPFAKQDGNT